MWLESAGLLIETNLCTSELVMDETPSSKMFRLIGANRQPYLSSTPGTLGGHRRTKVFGRLDCPAALRAIANGGYKAHRVFFADEAAARAAGFRPCGSCLPALYKQWKAGQSEC
jgi:metal binding Ada-like protein